MSNTQQRASRCVFVGNIPYDATEDQLVHICEEVGPVVNFRLVLDRETGKPKGYGFCEYRDEETALSARRNLQGYEINGRQLRVDFAENEKGGGGGGGDRNREQASPSEEQHQDESIRPFPSTSIEAFQSRQSGQGVQPASFNNDFQRQTSSRQVGSAIEADRSGESPMGQASANAAAQFLTGALGGTQPQQQQQQYGVSMSAQSIMVASGTATSVGNDPLTNLLAGMSKNQLHEVMVQMKAMIQQNPQQARQVLVSNPQLTKALFQAQIMLGMVRAPPMTQGMLPTQQQQQQRVPAPPPMQQPPLPPQPRPAPPSVLPGQVQQQQQSNSLQPMTYQPPQVQQQSLSQAQFQHQGDMVQQSSSMSMSYVQQGLPAPPTQPLQQQYQNTRMDGSSGSLAGMISGSEAVMGRNMNISQAGMGTAATLMNQQQPSPPASMQPGQGMLGLVMASGNQASLNTGVSASTMGASLVPDNRSNYGNQSGLSDGGLASASNMYAQMPTQQQQMPQMTGELEQQKALLQQVLSLTPEQIISLPPEQRQQVLQLQQALRA